LLHHKEDFYPDCNISPPVFGYVIGKPTAPYPIVPGYDVSASAIVSGGVMLKYAVIEVYRI
jgi:hypothetical protein